MNKPFKVMLWIGGVALVVGLTLGSRAVWSEADANDKTSNAGSPATKVKGLPVVLTPARQMTFEQRLVVSGDVQAKNYALVSARIPGTLDVIHVDEGDQVEAGKTLLFQTDSLKLTKAVALARQGQIVAEAALREKQARLEQAIADKQQVERDTGRFRQLASQHAIPLQQAEQYEARLKQAVAAVKDVQALIELAKAQLEQARLSVAIAEKDLADSQVIAPISGWVSERRLEPGEMADAGTPVLRIDDLSVLEISVYLPEQYYDQILPGKTKMRIRVGTLDLGTQLVSYRSPTVSSTLRTFETRALVKTPPAGVVPGRLAQVTVVLDAHSGIGVPVSAVQQRAGERVVFTVENGRAKMVPVETKGETDGWLEVKTARIEPGTRVMTMGQDRVDDGSPVTVVKGANQ